MELLANSFTFIHVIAGFSALMLFWIPIFARKGGLNHRKVGKIYVNLMWVVVVTALLLSVKNLVIGRTVLAAFLGFLALITARPLWLGTEVLNNKGRVGERYRFVHSSLGIVVVLAGMALIGYGVAIGGRGIAIFMYIFGFLGVLNVFDLVSTFRNPVEKVDWLRQHISGLCVSGIAAHTAFLAFGANNLIGGLFNSYWSFIPWVAPTVIGLIGIRIATRMFQPRRRIAAPA